jgi:hypothetical protein
MIMKITVSRDGMPQLVDNYKHFNILEKTTTSILTLLSLLLTMHADFPKHWYIFNIYSITT